MKFPVSQYSLLCLAGMAASVTSFAPNYNAPSSKISSQRINTDVSKTTTRRMVMFDDTMIDPTHVQSALQSTTTFLSTISADIDNIADDQFGKVFAGGIVVMIGGVVSALVVGFLLESGNSYANVVADSYVQGGDEEFWESLSPDDQVKAKQLMAKLRASKEGREYVPGEEVELPNIGGSESDEAAAAVVKETVMAASSTETTKKDEGQKKEVSMFSDYDD